jgi:cob(I)alamin adenosyltransferase
MRSFSVSLLLPVGAVTARRDTAGAALDLARRLERNGERVVVTTPEGQALAPLAFAAAFRLS